MEPEQPERLHLYLFVRQARIASAAPTGYTTDGAHLGAARAARTAVQIRSVPAPASWFRPSARVSAHSVSSRSVTHGTCNQYASFCTPPESVRITFACF